MDKNQRGTCQGVVSDQLARTFLQETQNRLLAIQIILTNKMLVRILQTRRRRHAHYVSHKHQDYNSTVSSDGKNSNPRFYGYNYIKKNSANSNLSPTPVNIN